jgi:hypothetical protein
MTRRWNTAKADGLKTHLRERLTTLLPNILSDSDLQVELFREQLEETGNQLSDADAVRAKAIFQSGAFQQNVMTNASVVHGPLLDYFFDQFEARFDGMIDATMAKCGVLSLTEEPLNRAMWSYYAGAGTGFVVGLDPQHSFFFNEKGGARNHVLRKVRYTDDRVENFWQNPYYLFLVKNTEYRHEREWRMFKQLSDYEQRVDAKPPICLWNIPADMIKSVHFGYAYNPAWIDTDVSAIKSIGASPITYSVIANRGTGDLEAMLI